MQRLYEAYGRGELDAVLAELADDVDWAAEAASTSVPWYGRYHGKNEVPGFFEAIATNVDVTEFELVGCTSNDTDVVATIRWSYRVRSTGKTATMYMQHWWRFADGKIVFFRGRRTPSNPRRPSHDDVHHAPRPVGDGPRVAVKDIIDVAGTSTTAGCRAVERTAVAADRDASCLAGARAADARLVGKTNLHELAMLPIGTNPWFGTPANPLDRACIPGGSSSGCTGRGCQRPGRRRARVRHGRIGPRAVGVLWRGAAAHDRPARRVRRRTRPLAPQGLTRQR